MGKLKNYQTLAPEMQQALDYWISKALRPAAGIMYYSSAQIKHDYECEAGINISNAQFKDALLAAGYIPINKPDDDWILRVRPTYDKRRVPHRIIRQFEGSSLPTFRIHPLGEPDAELQRLIALAVQVCRC